MNDEPSTEKREVKPTHEPYLGALIPMRAILRLAAAFVMLTGTALAQQKPPALDLKGKTLKQTFDELLPKMDTQGPQQQWQSICLQLSAPGNEVMRAEACKLMVEKLNAKTPNQARIWLLA